MREPHHARAMPIDLEHLTDTGYAQLLLVDVVDHHRIGNLKVANIAFHNVPWPAPAPVWIEADDLNLVLATVQAVPACIADDVLLHARNAGYGFHLVKLALVHRHSELEIRNVAGGDPEIDVRVIDQRRGCARESNE